jgi:hypothetical protein
MRKTASSAGRSFQDSLSDSKQTLNVSQNCEGAQNLFQLDSADNPQTLSIVCEAGHLTKIRRTLERRADYRLRAADDRAPIHNSKLVIEKRMKEGLKRMPHPAHGPDPSPCEFFLFGYRKDKLIDRAYRNRTRDAVE